jgi:hypothetical protein
MLFKVGDDVTVIEQRRSFMFQQRGKITKVGIGYSDENVLCDVEIDGSVYVFNSESLALTGTIDALISGDVIEKDNTELTVVERGQNSIGYKCKNSSNVYWIIIENLKKNGWKVKGYETKEMTVEEVSNALGYEVKIVRNKK